MNAIKIIVIVVFLVIAGFAIDKDNSIIAKIETFVSQFQETAPDSWHMAQINHLGGANDPIYSMEVINFGPDARVELRYVLRNPDREFHMATPLSHEEYTTLNSLVMALPKNHRPGAVTSTPRTSIIANGIADTCGAGCPEEFKALNAFFVTLLNTHFRPRIITLDIPDAPFVIDFVSEDNYFVRTMKSDALGPKHVYYIEKYALKGSYLTQAIQKATPALFKGSCYVPLSKEMIPSKLPFKWANLEIKTILPADLNDKAKCPTSIQNVALAFWNFQDRLTQFSKSF